MRNPILHWRNGFHVAWLLVPLAAIVPVMIQEAMAFGANGLSWAIAVAALALGAGLTSLGLMRPGVVVCQFGKEIRFQMPAAMLGLLAPFIANWTGLGFGRPVIFVHCFSCAFLSATAFGAEFDARTMAGLLAQPCGRARIYCQKMVVLAVFLGLVTLSALVVAPDFSSAPAPSGEDIVLTLSVAVAALCSGPFFGLLARGTLAGAIFAFVTPAGLAFLGDTVLSLVWHWRNPDGGMIPGEVPGFNQYCIIVGGLYLVGTAVMTWRTFSRLQVRDAAGSGDSIHGIVRPLDAAFRAIPIRRGGIAAALVRKELRLHLLPWIVAGFYLVLALIFFVGNAWMGHQEISFQEYQVIAAIGFGVFTILLAGTGAIAEERQLGTLDWQLTIPCSVRRQWLIKLLVAAVVGLALGLFLPVVVTSLVAGPAWEGINSAADPLIRVIWLAMALWILSLGVFASSLSKSTAKAAVAAVGLAAAILGLVILPPALVASQINDHDGRDLISNLIGDAASHPLLVSMTKESTLMLMKDMGAVVAPLIWIGLWLVLAAQNFRNGAPAKARLARQLGLNAALALAMGFLIAGWIIQMSFLQMWRPQGLRQVMVKPAISQGLTAATDGPLKPFLP